jgi:hypothetical protein
MLQPAAVQTVTVEFGPSLSGWVATSSTYVVWPVYVQLVPVRGFDPNDAALLQQMLTLEGQLDPYFSQRFALARLERFRALGSSSNVGIASFGGITDLVNDRATKGTYINMADLPPQGAMAFNMLLPQGIALADARQLSAGAIPIFENGNVVAYSSKDAGGAASSSGGSGSSQGGNSPTSISGVTALFAKSIGAGAPSVKAKVPVASSKPAATLTVASFDVGPWKSNSTPDPLNMLYASFDGTVSITLTVSWSFNAANQKLTTPKLGCTTITGLGAGSWGDPVTFQGSKTFSWPSVEVELGHMVSVSCSLSSSYRIDDDDDWDFRDIWVGDYIFRMSPVAGDADATKKKQDDKKKADDNRQKGDDDTVSKTPDLTKDPAAGGTTGDPGPVGGQPPADPGTGTASGGTPPTVPNPPVVQSPPPTPTPRPAPPPPTPTPRPAPPPPPTNTPLPPPPPPQPQFQCANINPAAFKSGAEGDFYRANCPGGALNCDRIRALPLLQRTDRENTWFVQNCNIPTPSPCSPGQVDSGSVPAGVGATRPLDPRCSYRVCLSGTIHGSGGAAGTGRAYNPAQALMRANGQSIAAGCVTFARVSGPVSFNCDGAAFPGIKFSGAFGYTVQRVGPA